MTAIGPVQFVAVGISEEATYEGRILAEIESIEASGSILADAIESSGGALLGPEDMATIVTEHIQIVGLIFMIIGVIGFYARPRRARALTASRPWTRESVIRIG
jgi:hypothetical protein